MTIYAVLQLNHHTDRLSALVDHLEGTRYLTDLHRIHHLGHLGRQVLHTETRCNAPRLYVVIRHQTLVITGILIIRQVRCSILKSKLTIPNIHSHGIQTNKCLLNRLLGDDRFTEDMSDIHFLTTFLYQLNNMESEFRLHDF